MRPRLAALALLGALGCTSFPVIEAGECGNQVLESGEDCDTFVDKALVGSSCRPKGVVEACRFDCSRDADGKRYVCPSGMGCAPEGICRRVGDGFNAPEKLASEVSGSLSALDFDGDGRRELLGTELPNQNQQARFSLHYFDADTELVESRRFPRLTSRPVARDVGGDGRQDLLVSNGRIGLVPGREDREWLPAAFSSYVLEGPQLNIVPVYAGYVSDSIALVAITSLEDRPGLYLSSAQGGLELHLGLERSLPLLLKPLAADLVEADDSPCDELVLAFRGDTSFRVIDLCEVSEESAPWNLAWRKELRQQVVRLPGGATIQGPPVAGDVDGDGHLDVLIGDGERSYLARGDGVGLEPEAAPFSLLLLGKESLGPVQLASLLAAGDITGDGLADFVLPGGVIGSLRRRIDQSVAYLEVSANSGQPWSMAEIVDLNGNELPDVAAAAAGRHGITFLSGTGGLFQVESLLSTTGPVRLLASGDVDGDQIRDIAFLQGGSRAQPRDTLAIAFGNRDRSPTPAVRVSELDGVEQLGSLRDGAMDDIFTASTALSGGVTRSTFTLFEGSAERMPLAPYTLNQFSVDTSIKDWQAVALLVGGFTAPGASDVVAIGLSPTELSWTQWLVPNIGNSTSPPRLLKNPSSLADGIFPATVEANIGRVSVAGVAADLEGDGFDEALWLMPDNRGPSCALLMYDVDGDAESATLTTLLDLDEACVAPELAAIDLNQDGRLDLMALVGDAHDRGRRIAMLWNDGQGRFSLADRTYLEVEGEDIRAFSMLPPPGIRLAFVTDRGLYLAQPRSDQRQFEVTGSAVPFEDARGVVATDLNGDHIAELVVADATGLSLLRAALK